jgi:hypothetical protein
VPPIDGTGVPPAERGGMTRRPAAASHAQLMGVIKQINQRLAPWALRLPPSRLGTTVRGVVRITAHQLRREAMARPREAPAPGQAEVSDAARALDDLT